MSHNKPKILILTDFYLPGYKSGGGLRTLVNMVERLGDEFEFRVVTRNHDGWGDFTPYPNVRIGEWNEVDETSVYYFDKQGLSLSELKKIWHQTAPQAVYLNSFFSTLTVTSMLARTFRRVPDTPLVIAPEGEFSSGALRIKAKKKNLFLVFSKRLDWKRNVFWKAAAEEEKSNIEKILGTRCKIYVAPNMPPKEIFADYAASLKPLKKAGEMRLIFLSRINHIKNLSFVLERLKEITGEIVLDIFGAIDNADYWQKCQGLLREMPANIRTEFRGSIEYERVAEVLGGYHFFILPTLGENFGHVILEALAAGCPVLLSDKTPWRKLETKGVGYDVSLDDLEKWRTVLHKCSLMTQAEYSERSNAARSFALDWLAAPEVEAANRAVLRFAVEQKSQNY